MLWWNMSSLLPQPDSWGVVFIIHTQPFASRLSSKTQPLQLQFLLNNPENANKCNKSDVVEELKWFLSTKLLWREGGDVWGYLFLKPQIFLLFLLSIASPSLFPSFYLLMSVVFFVLQVLSYIINSVWRDKVFRLPVSTLWRCWGMSSLLLSIYCCSYIFSIIVN